MIYLAHFLKFANLIKFLSQNKTLMNLEGQFLKKYIKKLQKNTEKIYKKLKLQQIIQ